MFAPVRSTAYVLIRLAAVASLAHVAGATPIVAICHDAACAAKDDIFVLDNSALDIASALGDVEFTSTSFYGFDLRVSSREFLCVRDSGEPATVELSGSFVLEPSMMGELRQRQQNC